MTKLPSDLVAALTDPLSVWPQLVVCASTGATPTNPCSAPNDRVFWSVGVAFRAMCSGATMRASQRAGSSDVVPDRASSQMIRIHTQSVSAQMINDESMRDGTLEQFIGEAMGVNVSPMQPERAIGLMGSPRPDPAIGIKATAHFRPKPIGCCNLGISHWPAAPFRAVNGEEQSGATNTATAPFILHHNRSRAVLR